MMRWSKHTHTSPAVICFALLPDFSGTKDPFECSLKPSTIWFGLCGYNTSVTQSIRSTTSWRKLNIWYNHDEHIESRKKALFDRTQVWLFFLALLAPTLKFLLLQYELIASRNSSFWRKSWPLVSVWESESNFDTYYCGWWWKGELLRLFILFLIQLFGCLKWILKFGGVLYQAMKFEIIESKKILWK